MRQPLSADALKQIFTEARSYHAWQPTPVTPAEIEALYELFKWGPTAVNAMPARFVVVQSEEAKARLVPAMMPNNRPQIQQAPATVIIAYDEKFYEKLDQLWPAYDMKPYFLNNPQGTFELAFRNSSFQGAYLMLAARALGLDVGPLSGFDNAMVDALFLEGTGHKSNFICMIGHGKAEGLYPRGPRLSFAQSIKIV